MARITAQDELVTDALRAAGIRIEDTRRVIVDIQVGRPVVVHVEQYASVNELELVRDVLGSGETEIRYVPKEDEG